MHESSSPLRVDEPVACAACVLQDGVAVRFVFRDEEVGWRLLTTLTQREEMVVARWGELVRQDPSLAELADLASGWFAWRETSAEPWCVEPVATPPVEPAIDFRKWFARVLGWDAVLPVLVSAGSVSIARLLNARPPADILALVGLPVVAFAIRLMVGVAQIRGNYCARWLRRAQYVSLLIALFVLAFVDFFIAWAAFVPPGNAPQAADLLPVSIVSVATYLSLVAFAMYPGRASEPPPQ